METKIEISVIVRGGLVEAVYRKPCDSNILIDAEVYDYDNMRDASEKEYRDFCKAVQEICNQHEQLY